MTTTEASLPTENPRMTAKQHYWFGHIKACVSIGQSLSAYAAEHHLALKFCYRWKSHLTQMGLLAETVKAPVFRPLQIKPASISTGNYRFTLPNGIQVEIKGTCDPAQLKQVFTTACLCSVIMMKPANELSLVYLCSQPVDFRKGMMGLTALVLTARV